MVEVSLDLYFSGQVTDEDVMVQVRKEGMGIKEPAPRTLPGYKSISANGDVSSSNV